MNIIPKTPCVYMLKCLINGKIYIGKANNLKHRIDRHKSAIKSKHNVPIVNSIKKYGWDNFELEILHEFDTFDITELLALETAFIDFYDAINPEIGYNICLISNDGTGTKRTDAFKEHQRKIKTGIKHSEESKRKMSINNSRYWVGKHLSEETKEKLRNVNLGKIKNEETKLKIALSNIGKHRVSDKHPWKNGGNSGDKNPRVDKNVYNFVNSITNERFSGTRYNFYTKYGFSRCSICRLVKKQVKNYKNWELVN